MSFSSFWKRGKKENTTVDNLKQKAGGQYKKGDFIGDSYEVYGELGHGGFGIVYLVYSSKTKQVSALKTFKDEYLENPAMRELFQREAEVWMELERHPYIVRAYFVNKIEGRFYVAIEYIAPNEQGLNTLEGYLENQPPDLAQSLRWAIQFCIGMEYAYSKGLRCHRDIKPSNIMITSDKTVKISDFGLATVFDAAKAKININQGKVGLSSSILEGGGCGTPMYMSPEQFTNALICDQRSDIYSFGIVLFQMASGGKPPFQASHPRDDSEEERNRFWRESHKLHDKASVPKLNSPLFPIIQRCLEKKKDRRYQTFKELRTDIELILKRLTGEAIKPPVPTELESWEWLNKGISLNILGHCEEATECLDKAIELDPKNEGVWIVKGIIFEKLRRFEDAILCWDKLLGINPKNVKSLTKKGWNLHSLNRFSEAIKCYNKVLKIDPQDTGAWTLKGFSLDRSKRFEEAIKCYDKSLEIDPQREGTWVLKGICLDTMGYHRDALACFDKAIEINPKNTEAWSMKAANLLSMDRNDEAKKCIEKVSEIKSLEKQGSDFAKS